ncbi:DUF2190 family protein [Roseiconus lacunae]|uniref:DUF2190 family protein n=1 Tax=Roseiconus lacunae TaxID=2605694 RepID=A0ABT7PHI7_9BACT|nr:DUF2190 family protein [Roseiconus lacunae]MDM4015960.1 DUF2190 family protein [Roseiconus lacunae]
MGARFNHGSAKLTAKYTPGTATPAGTIVVQGGLVGVADHDIAANETDSIVVSGAVYVFDKAAGGSTAIAAGAPVYVDESAQLGTGDDDSGSNKQAGIAESAAGDSDTTVRVILGQK